MTQECLQTWSTSFACKISTLSKKYYNSLEIGSNCAKTYLFQLEVATALLEQICNIDLSEETCLSEAQVCELIDKLTQLLEDECNC
jgi:hypothetical protein